jgi:hypothetical protein
MSFGVDLSCQMRMQTQYCSSLFQEHSRQSSLQQRLDPFHLHGFLYISIKYATNKIEYKGRLIYMRIKYGIQTLLSE